MNMNMKMNISSLEKEMNKRGITAYKLTKLLGLNPRTMTGYTVLQIRGEATISPKMLKDMCKVISKHSKNKLDPDKITYKTVCRVRVV